MTNLSTSGDYTNGTTADGTRLTADFSAIKTFLNTTGVHVYQAGTIVAAALANSAVETAKINNGAVTNAKLGADCVDGTKIADSAVNTEHLATGAVTSDKLATGAVTSDKLAAEIEAGDFVADNSVSPRHLSKVVAVEITSDLNVNNPGTSTIGGTTVTSGEVVLLAGQVSTAHQNGPWIFNGSGSVMMRPTWYANTSVVDAYEGFQVHCLRGTFAGSRWRLSTSGTITVGSTSTAWQCLDYVGAGTTANRPSAARIAAGGIYVNSSTSTTERSDGSSTWTAVSISSSNIADGTIVNADISASAAIAYSKLNLSNSIVAGDLTSGSVTESKIGPAAVTSAKIDSSVAKSIDVQVFTSSGTWTKPSGAKLVEYLIVGGGGGGAGSDAAGSVDAGASGGSSAFASYLAYGGSGAPDSGTGGAPGGATVGSLGSGGAAGSSGLISITGAAGGSAGTGGAPTNRGGGGGGSYGPGASGGAGTGAPGSSAAANTGGGGGGAGWAGSAEGGGGGGQVASGSVPASALSGTETVTIGSGGSGGSGGTYNGGAGGSGIVIVTTYF